MVPLTIQMVHLIRNFHNIFHMTEYKGSCYGCGAEFAVSSDAPVPLFNRKGDILDWPVYVCSKCGMVNRYAKFSSKGNILFALPE